MLTDPCGRRRAWWLTAIVAACLPAGYGAQSPQTPVFRSGASVVPLTVTVLDQKGLPVTDLTAADFTVHENGRERSIINFFPQFMGPESGRAAVATPSSANGLAPASRRVFVIVLGYGRIQYPGKGIDGALKFVREHLLPGDAVALMAMHRTTEFTSDHQRIAKIIERYRTSHERTIFNIREYYFRTRSPFSRGGPPLPEGMLRGIDKDVFGDLAVPGPAAANGPIGLRNTVDLLFGMDRGSQIVVDKRWQQQKTFAEIIAGLDRAGLSLTDTVLSSTRLKIFAAIEHLRGLEGEKHLLVVGQDYLARNADDAAMVARRAATARVAVNFVWTFGTSMRGDSGCLPCRDVAEATGGHYTSLVTADKLFAQVDRATRSSYLLGYTPADPTLDGKLRDVRVTVNRPGVVVHFRRGYYAAMDSNPAEIAEWLRQSRVDAALAYDQTAQDIPLTLTVAPSTEASSTLKVEVKIDVAALSLETSGGRRTGRLEVQVHGGNVKQQVVGSTVQRVDLNLMPETYARFINEGYRHLITVPVTGPATYVKAVVYDYGSERVGSTVLTIKGRTEQLP